MDEVQNQAHRDELVDQEEDSHNVGTVLPNLKNPTASAFRLMRDFERKNPVEKWNKKVETFANSTMVQDLIKDAQNIQDVGERIKFIAEKMMGISYGISILSDPNENEEFIVDFKQMNCMTFVEIVLAIANADSYDEFLDGLQKIRYKKGKALYEMRNHYAAAEWVPNNNAVMDDVTESVGGSAVMMVEKKLHAVDYNNDGVQESIPAIISFIPTSAVGVIKGNIQDGDIILFTAKKGNTDVLHMGFALWQNDELHFVHAKYKQEIYIEEPLTKYLARKKFLSGIKVIRPKG